MKSLFGLRNCWVICFLLLFVSVAQAQNSGKISLNKKSHDLGEIGIGHDRLADFVITNTGSEEVFFLRKECDEDVVVKFSANSIKPGESATIRLKYNPTRKGPFTRKVDIYTSAENEAFILTLKGNVKAIEENMDLACPNFNESPQEKAVENVFTVEVIDKQTGNPIQGADVHFRPNPAILPYILTDKNGLVKQKTPIGLYDIWANEKGYRPDSTYIYVGKNTSTTVLYLDRLPDNPVPVFAEREDDPERTPENEIYKEKPGELSAEEYAPNNIVFLIDVSSSMGTPDKMPLLRIAMKQLLGNLRSIDKISIVTYADGTDVVMNAASADKKEKIADKIDGLRPSGNTQGGKAIREAYRVAEGNFIPQGNNIIILATDGDFNLGKTDTELFEFIQEHSKKGVALSVVGFGRKQRAIEKMNNIAQTGKGSYIHISNEIDAQGKLVEEIKFRSRRIK
ncbi:MAG: VWA domain-containing protein [Bacteroidia bacterium]